MIIVGKRVKNRQWYIGNKAINETKSYKYLGTIINWELKDSGHINDHLFHYKSQKNLNRMCVLPSQSIWILIESVLVTFSNITLSFPVFHTLQGSAETISSKNNLAVKKNLKKK